MKKSPLLVLLLTSLLWQPAQSQWVKAHGAFGGSVVDAFASGNTYFFAGSKNGEGGVTRSSDGIDWTRTSAGLSNLNVTSLTLTLDGTLLLAGTAGGGIFHSENQGETWTPCNSGLTDLNVNCLLAGSNGTGGTNLFAGTESGGAFRSTNNGVSWASLNSGLTSMKVLSLAVMGTILFAGTDEGGVFRSTNAGGSWTQVNSGLTDPNLFLTKASIYSLLAQGTNLYAAAFVSGPSSYFRQAVFISTDGGTSWTQTGLTASHPESPHILSLASIASAVFAAGPDGVFRSWDNGVSWAKVAAAQSMSLGVFGTWLYAGTYSADLFLSSDFGAHWVSVIGALSNGSIWALAMDGTDLYAGTQGGVFRTTNGAGSWNWVSSGLTDLVVHSLGVMHDTTGGTYLFAATEHSGVFRSSDHGATWVRLNLRASIYGTYDFCVSRQNLFVSSDSMYRSTDYGNTWTKINNWAASIVAIPDGAGGTRLFAATTVSGVGGVFRSTDDGATWTPVNIGLPSSNIHDLAVIDTTLFAGVWQMGSVYRSSDYGASWTSAGSGLPNAYVMVLAACPNGRGGNNLFAATQFGGIFLSTDEGVSWTSISYGLPVVNVRSLAARLDERGETVLYAGTDVAGLYCGWLSKITSVERTQPQIPEEFSLSQNYPNPFNPVTQINYTIGQEKDLGTIPKGPLFGVGLGEGGRSVSVQLVVYDILGREVKTLVNEAQRPGSYQVTFNAAGLASGVYYYRLTAGSFMAAKKLLLLK